MQEKSFDNKVIELSGILSNRIYADNLQATAELIELFDMITRKPLESPNDYCKMYDDSFYTYQTWDELVKSEIEQGEYGFTEAECKELLGINIYQLPCGWYVQYV